MNLKSALAAAAIAALCAPAQTPSPQEILAIGERAYAFAYPMVLMEFTRRAALERGPAPNEFNHLAAFPDARFRQVIRPNADTLYSSSWLDLSKEPVLLHVPDTRDRYYLMQFMDAWTETFAIPGKRTTGTGEGWFAIAGPTWKGDLPARAKRIDSPTNMVWLLGRTQTDGASDYENVYAIQRGYLLMPLSLYPDGPGPKRPPARAQRASVASLPPPLEVERLTAEQFFGIFAQLLVANPPHAGDEAMTKEIARIGIVAGKPFHADALGPEGAKALESAAATVSRRLAAAGGRAGRAGPTGWTGSGKAGRYGTDYAFRAAVARMGLGANPPEDAMYMHCDQDESARPLDGAQNYRIHFEKGKTPPVRAFWSVTVYSEDGYFTANPIGRYAIGDRDPLKFNDDGSLDLYIRHTAPGGDKDANWLPSPQEKFNLSLRLYWPADELLNGIWIPPAVIRESK
jgi:hypothetical protein